MLRYNDTKVILQHVGHTMVSNQGIIDFTGMETFAKEICGVLTVTKKIIGPLNAQNLQFIVFWVFCCEITC